TEAAVAGASIVFTTTNGTRAIHLARGARRVLIGCFANLSAIQAALADEERVHLVCAGTGNQPTLEDTVFAVALAARLTPDGGAIADDQARMARELWSAVSGRPDGLLHALRQSRGGRNLAGIGLARDIEECARVDTRDVVPELIGDALMNAS